MMKSGIIEEVRKIIEKDLTINSSLYFVANYDFLFIENRKICVAYFSGIGNCLSYIIYLEGGCFPLIMLPEELKEMSEEAQMFFILHELGHILNGDIDPMINAGPIKMIPLALKEKMSRSIIAIFGGVMKRELKADKFAFETLEFTKDKMKLSFDEFFAKISYLFSKRKIFLAKKEVSKRIEAVTK